MKQKGRNSKYPETISVWRYGEDIPEWLSDRAKIDSIDRISGKKTIKVRETSSGGIEVISSDGISILTRTTKKEDYICFGDNKVFPLSEIQLSLLYKKDEEK